MGAPIGNQNALGNNGGCPPYYDASNSEDIERVSKLCEEYFEQLPTLNEPPTVTGLTLYLGFESKTTLYEYAKKIEFANPIKRALLKIEQFHEIATSMGDKCTGNIFILKNFGWKDTSDINHSGEIKGSTIIPITQQQAKDLLNDIEKDI